MSRRYAVRVAAREDLKELVALCDAFNAHSGLPTGRLTPASFRAAMFGPKAFMTAHVARSPERGAAPAKIVGYALSHDSFTTDYGERGVYVVDIYVDDGWRRSGVATALLRALARDSKKRGATHLWWASMPKNIPARRFYASLGATDEAIHSHAVFGRPFENLAKARSGRRPKPRLRP